MESEVLSRFILVFSSLFVIVEPFGSVPTFITLTKDYSESEVKRVVLRASLFGPAVLIFFSLFGIWVFKFLQLDMNAFRAAGGLLLLLTALDMLRAKNQDCSRCSIEEMNAPNEREDISLVPVALPMLAGPGAITSVVVFSTDHTSEHVLNFAILLAAILLTFLISYFVLGSSVHIKRKLGRSGLTVIQRIMGLLLAALSLQFIAMGLVPLVKGIWI